MDHMTEYDLLQTIKAVLDRSEERALCQACWQTVPLHEEMGQEHICNPVERGQAMVQMAGVVLMDHRKRARGYRVG